MKMAGQWLGATLLIASVGIAGAQDGAYESAYTKITDDSCVQVSFSEEGGSYLGACAGYGGYPLLLAEGDLRQSVFFGFVGEWFGEGAYESFSAFNSTNDTVEWRLKGGVPVTAILRWFIDNPNPETGSPDDANRGQVLVVSKVAQPGTGDGCVVGYVDALANDNANALARQVADTLGENFRCRIDEPEFHGEEGLLSSFPVRTFGP